MLFVERIFLHGILRGRVQSVSTDIPQNARQPAIKLGTTTVLRYSWNLSRLKVSRWPEMIFLNWSW